MSNIADTGTKCYWHDVRSVFLEADAVNEEYAEAFLIAAKHCDFFLDDQLNQIMKKIVDAELEDKFTEIYSALLQRGISTPVLDGMAGKMRGM